MNTCRLTSSVSTGAPDASWPHANMLLWVWDGFTLDSKKRACEQTHTGQHTRIHGLQTSWGTDFIPGSRM